ncbi:conserved hypothetical protein [Chlorobium limicola DSM 245]|uniref:DUF4296 domain-containing protein n=1 Tax=Chlorobium limicola (strain DSM 245 / NBRC 103803 / 6330) TaxID=290315 RepID=B3EC93_CHLL2|nr:conserved hypothetical protein [Chlorobium limicola DSM 245]
MDVQEILRSVRSRSFIVAAGALLALPFFAGCGVGEKTSLDMIDRRFASFYSDYLIRSGVTAEDDPVVLLRPDSDAFVTLLGRHSLTPYEFNCRMTRYRQQPERWNEVLLLVRKNLQKEKT